MGNKFLAHIREVDAIVHVVRCFEDSNIVHVDGSVDPVRDMETINLELIYADLETIERRIDKAKKNSKSGDKSTFTKLNFLNALRRIWIPASLCGAWTLRTMNALRRTNFSS